MRVPTSNLLLGEGAALKLRRAFESGRIHPHMRTIGAAEAALEALCKPDHDAGGVQQERSPSTRCGSSRIAEARTDIEMNQLLSLEGGVHDGLSRQQSCEERDHRNQTGGARMALKIIDDTDPGMAASARFRCGSLMPGIRTRLRLADGPDGMRAFDLRCGKWQNMAGHEAFETDGVNTLGMR